MEVQNVGRYLTCTICIGFVTLHGVPNDACSRYGPITVLTSVRIIGKDAKITVRVNKTSTYHCSNPGKGDR